ncbi:hypothetical protein PV367_39520 [Streptomyces europaeiscabiei]|uniref:Uncharacterized protein n=1 Tax=Streptomyces europaeiscabiei TaxID=146819 RepID=A0AAJ2PXV2_9ACTN|nr:hypothetical protein [Streptomyces europaeiscabiei]MDX3135754.1 hypothetical protein [Streptomyces europaeiscabiei]
MLKAAKAAQAAMADEEPRVRASAEKWIGAVTALIGLFGLSGLLVGKDSFTGMPTTARVLAAIAAGIAAAMAAVAVIHAYKAAYTWPEPTDISNDIKLEEWYNKRRDHARTAAGDLKTGVISALVSLAALAVAVGLLWFSPRDSPARPLVKVTRVDDSSVCGTLLDTQANRELRVRRPNGDVLPVRAIDIKSVAALSACSP